MCLFAVYYVFGYHHDLIKVSFRYPGLTVTEKCAGGTEISQHVSYMSPRKQIYVFIVRYALTFYILTMTTLFAKAFTFNKLSTKYLRCIVFKNKGHIDVAVIIDDVSSFIKRSNAILY